MPDHFPFYSEDKLKLETVTDKYATSAGNPSSGLGSKAVSPSVDEDVYQLAAWAAGLESFLVGGGLSYGGRGAAIGPEDHSRDLLIARDSLQRCARITHRLMASYQYDQKRIDVERYGISFEELRDLNKTLRELLFLAESLNRSERIETGEWREWANVLTERFAEAAAFSKFTALADSGGEEFLPEVLRKILSDGSGGDREEFEGVLPRFGRILRMLSIVRSMLDGDEPLKPALLIFSKVSEQIQELIGYLNHRIERAQGVDEDVIGTLDGAAYTASIELKKVVNQELAGLSAIRPATAVYARTESAYSLLNESFQQILTGFANQFSPGVNELQLFPNFAEKLDRSVKLRKKLQEMLDLVQAAEREPDKGKTTKLNESLLKYTEETVGYLFYKDTETFERFVEEILVTRQKKDLVPILHRFGAYLETLLSQVNMRAVLQGQS